MEYVIAGVDIALLTRRETLTEVNDMAAVGSPALR
jgi:hypothetical protein